MTCRFLKPAHYDELIEVESDAMFVTPVRLTVEYQVTRSGTALCWPPAARDTLLPIHKGDLSSQEDAVLA